MAELEARTALGATDSVPLAAAGRAQTVILREMPLRGCLNLRLDSGDGVAMAAAASVLGAALPLAPNTWIEAAGAALLWQAYDEWVIITPEGRQAALGSALHSALSGSRRALSDVSDLRAAFELRGPRARDVLQKGCAIDLHPRVFGPGTCVQAALARVRVTLRQVSATPAYEVLVERSYARYLWTWLTDAAIEYA